MQWQLLVFSMVPLLAFAGTRRWAGTARALVLATVVSALELALNSALLGFLEPFSLSSFVLFAGFSWLAHRRSALRWLQAQPVALEVLVAAVFMVWDLGHGTPLLVTVVTDHLGLIDWLAPWQRGYWEGYARALAPLFPFVLLVHAGLTAWAARRLGFGAWLAVRTLGLYALLTAVFLVQRLLEASR
jgi:hypothetical protein